MEVEVIKGSELSDDMKSLWQYYQLSNVNLSNPFFSHEFVSIVSSCRNNIYIALIIEDGDIIGFFPFNKGRFGLASPVGGAMSDYHGYISNRDINFRTDDILKKSGISRWSFDHLISQQTKSFSSEVTIEPSPIIDISSGYEDYKNGIRNSGSKILNEIGRKQRKLEKEIGPIRVELCSKSLSELNICIEGKKKQYIESGLVDPFIQSWTVDMLEKIQAHESSHFSGMLTVLYAGDKVVATHMGMRTENVWHWWFPTYDHDFAKYSPGLIILASIINGACDFGMNHIDIGKGSSRYKNSMKNNEVMVAKGVSTADSSGIGINTIYNAASKYEDWLERQLIESKILHLPGRVVRRIQRDNKFK